MCPLRGRAAPQLAAGEWRPKIAGIFQTRSADLLHHTFELTTTERAALLQAWQQGQSNMKMVLEIKFSGFEALPKSLCGLAHDSEHIARGCGFRALQQFACKESGGESSHWPSVVYRLLDADGDLRPQLDRFLAGQPRESLSSSFMRELCKLRLIPVSELSIEAKHAVAKLRLRSAANVSPALFSLSLRFWEIEAGYSGVAGAALQDAICEDKVLSITRMIAIDRWWWSPRVHAGFQRQTRKAHKNLDLEKFESGCLNP